MATAFYADFFLPGPEECVPMPGRQYFEREFYSLRRRKKRKLAVAG
jgi:hypothetical protein